ncbi:MAG: ExbD/TolR family protein [Limisphaerales bacterium]
MKIRSRRKDNKARIEIIPLIDIMFFLLACFMLVSLSMTQLRSIKVNLPTAATAAPEQKPDFFTVSVDKAGKIYFDKEPVDRQGLLVELMKVYTADTNVRVFINGDREAVLGPVIDVLDRVRSVGISKVAFQIHRESPAALPP